VYLCVICVRKTLTFSWVTTVSWIDGGVLEMDHAEKLDESAFLLRHLFLSQESGSRGLLELLNMWPLLSQYNSKMLQTYIQKKENSQKFPSKSIPKAIPDVTTPLS
jgi:hypothetical protein